jgi:hypothetical protein
VKQLGTAEPQGLGLQLYMITNFNTTLSTFHDLFEQKGKIPRGWKVGFPISCYFAGCAEFSPALPSLSEADCFYEGLPISP